MIPGFGFTFIIHYSFDLSGFAHEEGGGRVFIVSTNALD